MSTSSCLIELRYLLVINFSHRGGFLQNHAARYTLNIVERNQSQVPNKPDKNKQILFFEMDT